MSTTTALLCEPASFRMQGGQPVALGNIYQPGCHLAVWQRHLSPMLADYSEALIRQDSRISMRTMLKPEAVMDELHARLPDLPGREAFAADVQQLVEMFACLFELPRVGVRLASLHTAMCPNFHVDRVPCRLMTTYFGPGTHWLDRQQRDLLLAQQGKAPEQWQQLAVGEVALLKGDGWEEQDGQGVWHRSPPVPTDQGRLFLSLDFAD
ncbi:DUF1826 domain-containing protein [Zobellella maritima]|uniref:DUF1826 domain-containing protein n=1 Tax=Zobellella maritima TaxID=2059725 RepID=UPI000E30300E|nr:DUF1826 domain-containing protein [Zobellella maritima]